jgi:hypothetical protein
MITAIARTTPKLNANPDSCGIPAGAINAVLAAAGYNFRRLLAWLRVLLLRILIAQQAGPNPPETMCFGAESPLMWLDFGRMRIDRLCLYKIAHQRFK